MKHTYTFALHALLPGFIWIMFLNITYGQHVVNYKKYTSSEGLPANVIQSVYQDRLGFIWVGTGAGLSRYDGYEFKNYQPIEGDSTSIQCSSINDIFEDIEGNIWLNTNPCGITIFNRSTEIFSKFNATGHNDEFGIATNIIKQRNNGDILLGSVNGVIVYDKKANVSRKISKGLKSEYLSGITNMLIDETNQLWVTMDNAFLYRFDSLQQEFKEFNSAWSHIDQTISIFNARDGGIWINYSQRGLFKVDPKLSSLTKVDILNSNMFADLSFFESVEDAIGNIWIPSSIGLIMYDKDDRTYKFVNESDENFGDTHSHTIIEDAQNNLWQTTGSGLIKIIKSIKFKNFRANGNNKDSFSSNDIQATGLSGANVVLLSNFYADIFDATMSNVSHIKTPNNLQLLISNYGCNTPYFNIEDKIYMITDNNKLHAIINDSIFSSNYLLSVVDNENDLWFGGQKLYKYDKVSKNLNVFDIIGDSEYIWAMEPDEDKGLWAVGNLDGVQYFDFEKEEITKTYTLQPGSEKTYSTFSSAIFKDKLGYLWIGNEKGLYKINLVSGKTEKLNLSKDGKNTFVNNILEDEHDNLWLGTANGIIKFNPLSLEYRTFNTYDGLLQNEFNKPPIKHPKTGEFWYGGINGLTIFFPDSLTENRIIPPIYFTEIKHYNSRDKNGDAIYHKGADMVKEMTLSYLDHIIEFKFAALNFIATEKNQYKYLLQGFQDEWINLGTKREVAFTNLAPGTYSFQVIASNNDGYWNEEGKTIIIHITPPWWKTWWAYLIYSLSFVFCIYYFIKWRSASLRHKNSLLERKVMERTMNLEQMQKKLIHTEKMAVLGEISRGLHDDIGTTLSKINLMSYLAQTKLSTSSDSDVHGSLKAIQTSAQEMVTKLKDLLWSINSENEDIGNLFEKIEQFAQTMTESKNIKLEYLFPNKIESLGLTITEKYQLYLICKEAINNAVKYSHASILRIEIVIQEDNFIITIHDNGLGFNFENTKIGSGLNNMRKRAESIKAIFNIVTAPKQGTEVVVALPIMLSTD